MKPIELTDWPATGAVVVLQIRLQRVGCSSAADEREHTKFSYSVLFCARLAASGINGISSSGVELKLRG